MSAIESRGWYSRSVSPFLAFLQRNSLQGARKNIHRHYDLDANFFRLWLDSQLVYSGAYFPSSSLSLEEAQISKMDYVCRKLNLQPGERVVDIGCGWGALALHMAKHYGVNVQAVSNSHEQILWARRRAAELRLTNQVEFIEDDYRNISTQCDALVSVGMLEHVGARHYHDMGRVIHRVLDSTGRGLIQTIGRNQPCPFNLWTRKRVFPGTYAPTLRQTMALFEPGDLSVVDVENLRPHYALTLEHWLKRFEESSAKVSEMFGPAFVRLWRLYLAGSIAGFRSGALQHFQILFARKACQRIPLTRAQLYAAEQPRQSEGKRIYAVH
jgi:cyclopropane-fatty-acyl-phospholipid synthase